MKQSFFLLLFASCLVLGCNKDETKFRDLQGNQEITYPGIVSNFKPYQGNLRIKLQWNPSPDPSITKYVIYWNNNNDSLTLPSTGSNTQDTVSTILSSMGEYVQNFVLYTYDGQGNRSIGQSLSGVRVFGPLYISSLVNRSLDANKPPKVIAPSVYTLFFASTDTLNVNTSLTYTDTQQQLRTVNVSRLLDTARLEMATAGTRVAIRSSYEPVRRAIDTFLVTYSDTVILK